MDEVTDIQAIIYDQKRKSIMKRTTKKRRITLDSLHPHHHRGEID
jgi:hypothetical protein